ncbi:MAG: hypothetical protein KJS45_09720, partial [Bacteroidetes bacterium]|nr:hypothetical protein [Bacteroidota bacterium]
MSDTGGNFICYTNGIGIYNSNHELIENGDSLNCCNDIFPDYYDYGYAIPQGIINFTFFNKNQTWFIHKTLDFDVYPAASFKLLLTKIKHSPLKVVKKNQLILKDTLYALATASTRHANGRDWWLIQQKYKSNKYFIYNISENSINSDSTYFDNWINSIIGGQRLFTPDGLKYIETGAYDTSAFRYLIRIFDFDRCTGTLSNPIHFEFVDSLTASTGA